MKEELDKVLLLKDPTNELNRLMNSGFFNKPPLTPIGKLKGCKQDPIYHPEGDAWEHTLIVIKNTPNSLLLRYGALLHDIGKPETTFEKDGRIKSHKHENVGESISGRIMKGLGFNDEDTSRVKFLVKNHMKVKRIGEMRKKKVDDLMSNPWIDELITLGKADDKSKRLDKSKI